MDANSLPRVKMPNRDNFIVWDPNKIEYDGYYEDTYVRTPQGWRFKQRVHHALLREGQRVTPAPKPAQ